jgi:hypothetical protein
LAGVSTDPDGSLAAPEIQVDITTASVPAKAERLSVFLDNMVFLLI